METKGWLLSLVAVGLLIVSAGPSVAQFPTPEAMGLNYSITAGAAFLLSENLDRRTTVTIGVSWYDLAGLDLSERGSVGLSGDWVHIERNDGSSVELIPVLVNYRQYGIIGAFRVFTNLGIGILATTGSIPEMDLSDGANFGWTGGIGLDLSNNLFFQARFIGGNNPGEDGLTSVQLGYRF